MEAEVHEIFIASRRESDQLTGFRVKDDERGEGEINRMPRG